MAKAATGTTQSRGRTGSPGYPVGGSRRDRRQRPAAAQRGRVEGVGSHSQEQPAKPANKREILADDKLQKVFGDDRCTMFEMNKHLSNHLS